MPSVFNIDGLREFSERLIIISPSVQVYLWDENKRSFNIADL